MAMHHGSMSSYRGAPVQTLRPALLASCRRRAEISSTMFSGFIPHLLAEAVPTYITFANRWHSLRNSRH